MIVARHLRAALLSYVALLAVMLTFLVQNTARSIDADRARREIAGLLRDAGSPRVPTTSSELEQQQIATRVMREASQIAVAAEFARGERAARYARITAWVLATGAVLLGIVLFKLLARAEELERMKRELVANVSHDLKSPLASMHEVNAAMLDGVAGPLLEAQRRLLLANEESARRLTSMVTKLLDVARLVSRPEVRRDLVDVADVARRAVSRLRPLLRVSQDLSLAVDDTSCLIRGDAGDVERVLDNLIENAIKFSPPGTTVGIQVASAGGRVVLRVSDQGPGIRDHEKQRVFDRFYQTEVGRATRARGLGLGLTICRSIVSDHQGTIDVCDNSPTGAVFTVSFPGVRLADRQRRMAETARSQLVPAGPRTT